MFGKKVPLSTPFPVLRRVERRHTPRGKIYIASRSRGALESMPTIVYPGKYTDVRLLTRGPLCLACFFVCFFSLHSQRTWGSWLFVPILFYFLAHPGHVRKLSKRKRHMDLPLFIASIDLSVNYRWSTYSSRTQNKASPAVFITAHECLDNASAKDHQAWMSFIASTRKINSGLIYPLLSLQRHKMKEEKKRDMHCLQFNWACSFTRLDLEPNSQRQYLLTLFLPF